MRLGIQHSWDGVKWRGAIDGDPLFDIEGWGYNLTKWRGAVALFEEKARDSDSLPKHYRLVARVGSELRVMG